MQAFIKVLRALRSESSSLDWSGSLGLTRGRDGLSDAFTLFTPPFTHFTPPVRTFGHTQFTPSLKCDVHSK